MKILAAMLAFALGATAQNTAVFPGRVATQQDLLIAANRYQTSVSAAVGLTDTTISVMSVTGFAAPAVVTIDYEIVQVCSFTGFVLNVCTGGRGFDGTTPAVHASNARVSGLSVAWHHNQLASEILALETWTLTHGGGGGGGGTWGSIAGTLANQTDLAAALAAKQATLTNGSVSNTLLANSAITVNGTPWSLGGSYSLAGGSAVWGAITGTLASQGDLAAALAAKQATLTAGSIANSILANSAITIAGTSCALGSVCPIAYPSLTGKPVTLPIPSTGHGIFWVDADAVTTRFVTSADILTTLGAGSILNSYLANSVITVNGSPWSLGGSYTVPGGGGLGDPGAAGLVKRTTLNTTVDAVPNTDFGAAPGSCPVTIASGAATWPNAATGAAGGVPCTRYVVTRTANITSVSTAPAGMVDGQEISVVDLQNGTGGFTHVAPANMPNYPAAGRNASCRIQFKMVYRAASSAFDLGSATTTCDPWLVTSVKVATNPDSGFASPRVDSVNLNFAVTNSAGNDSFGLFAAACNAHSWINAVTANGIVSNANGNCAQPAFTDLSGSVAAAQMPGLTGDVTSSAGTVGTTVVKVNGGAVPASQGCLGTNGSSQLVAGTCTGSGLANPTVTAGTGGVTINLTVTKDASSPTLYVLPSTTGSCGTGIAGATAASGSTFTLQTVPGQFYTAVADNAVTAGHLIVGYATTPGRLSDSGQTVRSGISSATAVCGFATTSATAGTTFSIKWDGTGYGTSGGGGGNVNTATGNVYSTGDQNLGAATNLEIPSSAGATPTGTADLQYDTTQGKPVIKEPVAGVTSLNRTLCAVPPPGTTAGLAANMLSTDGATYNTSASTAAVSSFTAFGSTCSIPANMLITGKRLRATVTLLYTASASNPTINFQVKLGSTAVLTGSGGTGLSSVANRTVSASFLIDGTAAASGSAPVEVSGSMLSAAINSAANGLNTIFPPASVATNGALTLSILAQFGAATGGNMLQLRSLYIEVLN